MAAMQFWGVEVKAKEPNKVTLEEGQVIHLSQATLGELKKDNEPVIINVKVADKKFVLGILNQSTPQLSFDLVFEQEFEISHNLKNGSVHFLGYSTEMPDEADDMFGDDSDEEDEEEPLPILQKENGKPNGPAKVEAAKPSKDNKPKPQQKDDSDDDSDDEEEESDEDDDSDEDMLGQSDDESDEDDDNDDESEDEKPSKPESGKKRPNADAKTPEGKKAKLVTPQKTDGKKSVHTATPHPSKKGSKTPGTEKSTPKSNGQVSCEPCKKSFNSDKALESHNKAKHAAK